MPTSKQLLTRQRTFLFIGLVTLLACIYMLAYGGRIESGDSLYLLDAVSSFVDYGDFHLDLAAGTRLPQTFDRPSYYPLPTVDAEPLQIILAAPLYWLAERLPGIGLTHAVWTFNIFVSAFAGGVLFLYALTLGYSEKTALLGALAFGLGTVIVPYAKAFFREPLTLLLLLLVGFFAERWRLTRYRNFGLLLLMLVSLVGVVLTKASAVVALPALLMIIIPNLSNLNRRQVLGLGLVVLVVGAVFAGLALFGDALGLGARYNPFVRFSDRITEHFPVALHSYVFSLGGSIWGTSPVVLLALPGWWLLYRRRQYRYIAVGLLMTVAFAVGYALLSGAQWFGGLSWPPRFLVPIVPYLIIGALPIIDRLSHAPPRWLSIVVYTLFIYSVYIQINAALLPWGAYARQLPPEANGLIDWTGGLNQVRWLRWVIIPTIADQFEWNIAWARFNLPGFAVAFALLALVCAVWLRWLLRTARAGAAYFASALLLPLMFFALLGGLLVSMYPRDPYYTAEIEPLWDLLPTLNGEMGDGDLILLSNRGYERWFLNYGKLDGARVITLPPQPGDRPSPQQEPQVVSANPDVLLTNLSLPFVHSLADARDRLWLLENGGPDIAWMVRPVERFMAAHYYPLRVIETAPTVRLIEYSTVDAPDPHAFRSPEVMTEFVYDDALRLVGYTLPAGTVYAPGDAVPISLRWRADAPLAADYRIAWFVRTADGAPVAQGWDSRPGGDFEQTSQWRVGAPVWDNRAIRLPADLMPGAYRLWVKVYALIDGAPVDLLVVDGETVDDVIAVLPTTIWVE